MASVSKRTWEYNGKINSAWAVRYTDQGGKRRSKTFAKKKDADAYCALVVTEVNRGIHTPDSSTVTFGQAIQAWLDDCERRNKIGDGMAGTTLFAYRVYSKKHVIPELGGIKLTNLKTITLQDFIDKKSMKYAYKTLRMMVVIMSLTLKFAIRREWLIVNPLISQPIRIPSRPPKEKAIPSKAEIKLILSALTARQKNETMVGYKARVAMVTLALFSGMRRGEIVGLQWENVDFKRRVINVRHSLSFFDGLKDPKTRAGIRTIPMAAPVEAVLNALAAEAGELTGYVIRGRFGQPISPHDVYRYWASVMKAAGLTHKNGQPKYTFHSLRHANVSLLIEQGLQPFHIKGLIGHGSIGVTMNVYGHLFPEDDSGRNALDGAASQFDVVASSPMMRKPEATTPLLVAQG